MYVKEKKVETFVERCYCSECDTELEKLETVLMCHPPKYDYFCIKCNKIEKSPFSYPKTIYREVE